MHRHNRNRARGAAANVLRSGPLTSLSVPVLVAILAVGTLYYGFAGDAGKVVVLSLEACVVSVVAYIAVTRLLPQHVTPRLLIASYQLQLFSLALIAVLGLPLSPPYHPFDISVSDAPFRVVAAMLIVPITVLVGALVCCALIQPTRADGGPCPAAEVVRQRRTYLVVAAVIHLLYWPATLEAAGVLGYACRVVATALLAAPFIAGRDSAIDRRLGLLWTVTIALNAFIGIVAGTRSKALVAAVLFVAGYISTLPGRRRLLVAICASIAAVPVIQLSGAVGVVRDQVGRGGLELMRTDHIAQVLHELTRELTSDDREQAEEIQAQGVSRLLAWTNVVVPLMTPDTIPYRGLAGLVDEGIATFRVASVAGVAADDFYEAGLNNAPARHYGFTVNANTSVEFTLLADGWSRGGLAVVVVFTLVVMIFLLSAESGCMRLGLGGGVGSVLILPLAKAAFFDANTSPLLVLLRGTVFSFAVVAVFVAAIEFSPLRLRRDSRRGGSSPGRRPFQLGAATVGRIRGKSPIAWSRSHEIGR